MKEQPWPRRHAIQLAAQLPEKDEGALTILSAVARLVTGYLAEPAPEQKPAPTVVLIEGKGCA